MDKDKVSVIMACYNCGATVSKAIDSILAQTYKNWIMICCDDGSTDNTLDILLDYKNKFPDKFIIIKNDSNKQLPYSLNHCLKYVNTEFVARMDGDDWSTPDRFEKQVKFLKEHPEYDLVGTGVSVSDGKKIVTSIYKFAEPTKETMLIQNSFSHASIMTYKRVFDALGGYSLDPSVLRVEDVDLWCRFLAAGFRGYNLRDELYVILENTDAIKRRNLKARINGAKTRSRGYKLMGLSRWNCIKPYFDILKVLVPVFLYKRIYVFRLNHSKLRKDNK